MMASSRKKQDEKNLKTLRELAALPQNKYCFDCNQRGPTYVNVTIGSFVCTKCSGMLRGLTPPHRVKSISMATFTNDEIDLLRKRGNEYCQKVWLGLYEGTPPPATMTDELANRDFMVEKYERRRYYLDPSKAEVISARPVSNSYKSEAKAVKVNGAQIQSAFRTRPEVIKNHNNNTIHFADFDKADIFTNSNGMKLVNGNNSTTTEHNGFANFDNNPVFNNVATSTTTTTTTDDDFSIFDLCYSEAHGPVLNQVPLFPKCSSNRWSMPPTTTFNNANGWGYNQNNPSLNGTFNGSLNGTFNGSFNGSSTQNGSLNNSVPIEDKYAALKDLDNELKSQKTFEWNAATGSNGSLYSSPTPTGSVSSPSPQSSIFGSPSQGQFMSAFPLGQESGAANISNPFSNGGVNWSNMNGVNGLNGLHSQQQQPQQQLFANPFRDTPKMNGFSQGFQPSTFPVNTPPLIVNGTNGWTPNPFKVGATTNSNSNNPFL